MANEQSKAAKRRFSDGAFHSRYFRGKGVDIGGKPDPLNQYREIFAGMQECKTWDHEDGDALLMEGVADNSLDFVHSSHCLEHMVDVRIALKNWIRIVKPGGYLIITIPDEDMFEQGHFPSIFNSDHKWTFTICKEKSWSNRSLNVLDLSKELAPLVSVERILLVRDFFRESLVPHGFDQTRTPATECAIEWILKKHESTLK